MALHIFNCSIDVRDAKPDYIAEDLSYNEIESIVELVLENVLGLENAVAEHEEHDTDDGSIELELEIEKCSFCQDLFSWREPHHLLVSCDSCFLFNYKTLVGLQFYLETITPPPWACLLA
jgi:hypothetical protein